MKTITALLLSLCLLFGLSCAEGETLILLSEDTITVNGAPISEDETSVSRN